MKRDKSKIVVLSLLAVIILSIFTFFFSSYIKEEMQNYKDYEIFSMASDTMLLTFNKNLDTQYSKIRYFQSMNNSKKMQYKDLIENFAQSDMIPSLSYLLYYEEQENIKESFSELCEFIENFNTALLENREKVFTHFDDGKERYTYDNSIFTFYVSKPVITKSSWKKLYNKYLLSIGYENIETYYARYNNFSEKQMQSLKKDYKTFYKKHKTEIVNFIAKDLSNFIDYLKQNYLYTNRETFEAPKILNNIEIEVLELKYKFEKNDRIFNSASKYYKYNYTLDLELLWSELATKNFPILYM